jgi:anti-sigma regulatory factor (Ser/Thr protein kinase)/anti-anti-sigma regulatory factor
LPVPPDLSGASFAGFFKDLDALLDAAPASVYLDCSKLHHANSSHINALWEAQTRCGQAGVEVGLTGVGCGLERVLRVLDIYDLFSIHAGQPEGEGGTAGGEEPELREQPGLEIEFETTTEEIDQALRRFHSFLRACGVPSLCAFDLETAFYEVATNIRRHAGLASGGSVKFTAAAADGKVSMRFLDSGCLFDPTARPDEFDPSRAIQSGRKAGLGLTMINRLVDTVVYERIDNRLNVLTLIKGLPDKRR